MHKNIPQSSNSSWLFSMANQLGSRNFGHLPGPGRVEAATPACFGAARPRRSMPFSISFLARMAMKGWDLKNGNPLICTASIGWKIDLQWFFFMAFMFSTLQEFTIYIYIKRNMRNYWCAAIFRHYVLWYIMNIGELGQEYIIYILFSYIFYL